MAANPRTFADLETYAEKGAILGAAGGVCSFCLFAVINVGIRELRNSKNPMVYSSFVIGCIAYAAGGAILGRVTGDIYDRVSFFPAPTAVVPPIPAPNNPQQIPGAQNRR